AASVVKEAKESTKSVSTIPSPIATNTQSARDLAIYLEDYTEKSFVVRGDTKSKKEELKSLGGKWIKTRDGSSAWNFSKKKIEEVGKLLEIEPILTKI
ncbi:TPA: hypothetical protein RQN21_004371, partial [Aeromonas hydrophila]|nr:hypothetical protein [Aeromonas hydrophila]